MALCPESPESQSPVRGAELLRWSDGSLAARFATDAGPFAARLLEADGPLGMLLAAPAAFAPTMEALARALAPRQVNALLLPSAGPSSLESRLRAAASLLARRGVRRVAVAAAGPDAAEALRLAPRLGAEAVCLLSPEGPISQQNLEELRGRPLYLLAGGEACEPTRSLRLRARAPCALWTCEPAPASLDPVASDLCALLVPWLVDALR